MNRKTQALIEHYVRAFVADLRDELGISLDKRLVRAISLEEFERFSQHRDEGRLTESVKRRLTPMALRAAGIAGGGQS